jgi:hypothetical protein
MLEAHPGDFQDLSVQLYRPYRLPLGLWHSPLSRHSQVSGQHAEPDAEEQAFSVPGAALPLG